MSRIITAWFREDPKEQASWYPQVGSDSSLPKFQQVYWRCVPTFFATGRRFNPDALLRFYTNAALPVVDGVDIGELLVSLGVQVVDIPYTFLPPVGYYGQWRSQFFVLDILKHLAQERVEAAVVLDTDCVFTGSLDPMFDLLAEAGAATYVVEAIADAPATSSNGLTAYELDALASDVSGRQLRVPYCGGEVVALRGDVLAVVAHRAAEVWTDSQARHSRGEIKFNEEAQLLSAVYSELGLPVGLALPYIRRIWTQRARDVRASDAHLPIWHLPGEKHYGFRQLLPALRDSQSWLWSGSDEDVRHKMRQHMGVPHRGPAKWLHDRFHYAVRKLDRVKPRPPTGPTRSRS